MGQPLLITGAAGNLGGFLARHLLESDLELRLMYHRRLIAEDTARGKNVRCFQADLARPETLREPCRGADCIIHFAGVLFRPRPERFLQITNTVYVRNLATVAVESGVRRFILVSFPQVEGPTTPEHPAIGRRPAENVVPISAHARTRLEAEHCVFRAAEASSLEPVIFRAGTIYGRGVLMVEAARWLLQRRLLAVWREPTWYHFLALADFLAAAEAAVRQPGLHGIYNIGDDQPVTIQEFLDRAPITGAFLGPGASRSLPCMPAPPASSSPHCCSVRRLRSRAILSASAWSPTSWTPRVPAANFLRR